MDDIKTSIVDPKTRNPVTVLQSSSSMNSGSPVPLIEINKAYSIDIIQYRINCQSCCFDSNDNNKKLTAQCTKRTFNKIENPFKGTFVG